MTHIGFTGTRGSLTYPQSEALREMLAGMKATGWSTLHHGDCLGADAVAAGYANHEGLWVVSHPPIETRLRAYAYTDEAREPADYLERDRAIVHESQFMIGTPGGPEVKRGSGTWYTIRYAREAGRPGWIIWPDGHITNLKGE
jgi:hypothetical protein